MTLGHTLLLIGISALTSSVQGQHMNVPPSITAGSAFSISTAGAGKAVLYIVGLQQVIRRDVQPKEAVLFPEGALYSAGHYLVLFVEGSATDLGEIDVLPNAKPATLSLLARPSRLPVGLHDGISGAVYVFDTYHNLITTPMSASLELSNASSATQTRNVTTRNGVAWTTMDSSSREGVAKFVARIGDISSTGVIDEVPGDPCGLTISAQSRGLQTQVQTSPIHDCSGNQIPDGTIVTFKETYNDMQSTVDVPIKRGIATVSLPTHVGAKISVASGVVAGNEIRLGGGR